MQRQIEIQSFFHNGDQHVCGYGNPHLRFDGVLRRAEESLDTQVLLDPFEEEFHLPAAFVQFANSQRWKRSIVGKEYQASAFGICISDTSEPLRIMLLRVENHEFDQLIAHQPGTSIYRIGIDAAKLGIRFGSCDKEAAGLMQAVETREVEISSIHHIESSRFWHKQIQDADILHLAVADMNEGRNGTSQIQKSMEFDSSLCFSEFCPWEQCKTQIDGSGIQSIDGFREIDSQRFLSIKLSCNADERLSKFEIDSPIPAFVGVGYCTATDLSTNSQVVEFGRLGTETGFDVPQTFPVCQLGKGHAQKMIQTVEAAYIEVAAMLLHDTTESMPRCIFHHLGENEFASEHSHLPDMSGKRDPKSMAYSSR